MGSDLIVSVPDHCLSYNFDNQSGPKNWEHGPPPPPNVLMFIISETAGINLHN